MIFAKSTPKVEMIPSSVFKVVHIRALISIVFIRLLSALLVAPLQFRATK
jgi:hypothetical protein